MIEVSAIVDNVPYYRCHLCPYQIRPVFTIETLNDHLQWAHNHPRLGQPYQIQEEP